MALYADAITLIKALWTAHWPAPSGVAVFWHENTETIVPDDPEATPIWLHLAVEFDADEIRGFGGGRLANDRALYGSIVLRVFAARGTGEATALDHLASATAAFRSRRSGGLSCIGDSAFPAPQATLNGLWWQRSALVSFEYRYQG
jgi:hypothetical protein